MYVLFCSVLFCSLAFLDPRVGHTMDVLSSFISIHCHSDWLFDRVFLSTTWCCLSRPCVVFIACMHLALFLALFLSLGNSLVSSWCDHSMLPSSLWQCLTVPSLLQLCWEPTHLFFFAVHETCRIFLSPFISKASRRVSSFFLSAQLLQPYVVTV